MMIDTKEVKVLCSVMCNGVEYHDDVGVASMMLSVMSLSQPSGAGGEGEADKLHGLTTPRIPTRVTV